MRKPERKRPSRLPREIRRRRFGAGFSSLVAVALALAVFVAANALSFRLWARWSFTPEAALSDQAVEALERVPGRLELVAAFERGHPLRDTVRALLASCQDAARAAPWLDLVVECADLNHDPAAGAALLRRESMSANSLLVRTGGRSVMLDEFDLSGGDSPDGASPASPSEACEKALVSALMSLMRPEDATVGFLVGRGEYDPSDDNPVTGASLAARALEKAGWRVRSFSLADGARVPAWCDVLVDAGPRAMFAPGEAEALSSWLADGGRALLLFDDPYASGLAPVLSSWGLHLEPPAAGGTLRLSVPATVWSDHPAVRRLSGSASDWASPCTVVADGAGAEPLIYVGGGSGTAESDQPRCVAMAVTGEPASGSSRAPRIVVAGDSDILSNGRLSSGGTGNARLLLSLIDWLGAPDRSPRTAADIRDGKDEWSSAEFAEDASGGAASLSSTAARRPQSRRHRLLVLCVVWPLSILAFGLFAWIPISRL